LFRLSSTITAAALVLGACANGPGAESGRERASRDVASATAPDGAPTPPAVLSAPEPGLPVRATFTGVASWYGDAFHGNLTANGEIYDQHALTAAHRTLPLPSLARVTRLDTGTSVIVRVNDRGPYIDGRIIDLSFAAAEELGFIEDGLADVRVEALGPADPEDRAAAPMAFDPAEGPPRFDPQTREPVSAGPDTAGQGADEGTRAEPVPVSRR